MAVEPTELAWAAGVFEGSGRSNVYFPPDGRGLRLTVNGNVATLLRFSRAVGVIGRISQNGKQSWRWRVQKREDALRILLALKPYLTSSIEHIEERAQEWAS